MQHLTTPAMSIFSISVLLCFTLPVAKIIDFERDALAVAEKNDNATWWANHRALQSTLASLRPGDTFVIPNRTFYVMGGIEVDGVRSVTIQIDGTIKYAKNMKEWPRIAGTKAGDGLEQVRECWSGNYWNNVTFTSKGIGTFDGQGSIWWGPPGIGYLEHKENRPRLLSLDSAKNMLFENIFLKNSPYWSFLMSNVDGLEVRNSKIEVRRSEEDGHSLYDLTAFNTDGFDVTGRNVWIHDSSIWNQDDCIAVKDANPSENMLFERIEASGFGLTIGSIGGGSLVRNITFRDIHMHKTVKGIYAKFRGGNATIEDVTFENIVIDEPEQYAIWIGPAQQADSDNVCAAHPCSLCWPKVPYAECNAPSDGAYLNITLRNITVNSAKSSPGVLMGGSNTPMKGIVFDDVRFNHPGNSPFGQSYHCENVADGVAKGNTFPVPSCFKDETGTCIGDGSCSQEGRTCCSGKAHLTEHCGSGSRCGCVAPGTCATQKSDCCSGKGHKTAACSLGVGYRCDGGSESDLVI